MTTALATRDDETYDGEIVEHRAPMTLFGTDDPQAVVERASTVATALARVIDERDLTSDIRGKRHVQVEGWTLLGSMLGVFAEVEWTRPLDNGWEARAVARTLSGATVGAAEAMCTSNEGRWRSADPYAIRSMAQTRAVSKALRMPLGFIMHLAGYSATPAEELDADQPESSDRGGRGAARQSRAVRSAPAPRTAEEQALLDELLTVVKSRAQMDLLADAVKVKGERANADELREMLRIATTPVPTPTPSVVGQDAPASDGVAEGSASATPTETPSSEFQSSDAATDPAAVSPPAAGSGIPTDEEILVATGGEFIPPKPGTKEYRALPSGVERAAAKQYWDAHKSEPQQETLAEALGAPSSD